MKKIIIKSFLVALLVTGTAIFNTTLADDGPPPPPVNGGTGGNVPGGGAPIGEGLIFLTMLGAAYGAKKWQKSKQCN
jgi:hypothetical protein